MSTKTLNVSRKLNTTALVDGADFDMLKKYRWYPSHAYAHTSIGGKKILMHHMILGKPAKGFDVDHIDGNGLNNTRANLRVVTHQLNLHNCKTRLDNTSGHPGVFVYRWKKFDRYFAYININGKRKSLGYHKTLEEAVAVRQEAKRMLFS